MAHKTCCFPWRYFCKCSELAQLGQYDKLSAGKKLGLIIPSPLSFSPVAFWKPILWLQISRLFRKWGGYYWFPTCFDLHLPSSFDAMLATLSSQPHNGQINNNRCQQMPTPRCNITTLILKRFQWSSPHSTTFGNEQGLCSGKESHKSTQKENHAGKAEGWHTQIWRIPDRNVGSLRRLCRNRSCAPCFSPLLCSSSSEQVWLNGQVQRRHATTMPWLSTVQTRLIRSSIS